MWDLGRNPGTGWNRRMLTKFLVDSTKNLV